MAENKMRITEKDFRKLIKENKCNGGYFLYGEEDYLKSASVSLVKKSICPDEGLAPFNCITLTPLDYTPDRLVETLMSMPIMAEQKLVILTGLDLSHMEKSDLKELIETLPAIMEYDYNIFLFILPDGTFEDGGKKPSQLYLQLSEFLTPVYYEKSKDDTLALWIKKHFESQGVSVTADFSLKMISYCSHSMYILASEIEKICWYVLSQNRKEATLEDLYNVSVSYVEYDQFDFANAIADLKLDRAFDILNDYEKKKVEPTLVLGTIIDTVCNLFTVSKLIEKGMNNNDISLVTGIHSYRVGLLRMSPFMKDYKRLENAVEACAKADRSAKLNYGQNVYSEIKNLLCCL